MQCKLFFDDKKRSLPFIPINSYKDTKCSTLANVICKKVALPKILNLECLNEFNLIAKVQSNTI